MNVTITSEQEAATAILFACSMHPNNDLSQSKVDLISRIMVLCSKFGRTDLNELSKKAILFKTQNDAQVIMEQCAPLISADFRETLFAMICEVVTHDGRINDKESEVLGMAALYLEIPVERMRIFLTAFLIRNTWNVDIIEEMH